MTPLDDLSADQRAVVELVLRRGRTYDQIGQMLSIDRASVRQRALSALDALGPETGVSAPMRALITDYLLGQLPAQVGADVSRRLATEPAARAWARVVSSELAPMASGSLPAIPSSEDDLAAVSPAAGAGHPAASDPPEPTRAVAEPTLAERAAAARAPASVSERAPSGGEATVRPRDRSERPRSSRRGGAILLGVGALIVIVVVLVIVLGGGSSKAPMTATTSASTPASTAPGGGTTATTATAPQALDTVKLSAAAAGSKAQGVAEAFLQSGKPYLAIVAVHLPANSHNYYAVWLSNSSSDSRLLGFAPPVTSAGNLQAATALQTTDTRYKQLLVTVETTAHPKAPGTTVLTGAFSLKLP